MAGAAITINGDQPSDIDFDLSIQGIPTHEAGVRFVVESDAGYDIAITCSRQQNNQWRASIPALQLRESTRPFRIEVIAGGYYFCPTTGSLQVKASPQVHIAEIVQPRGPAISVSANFASAPAAPVQPPIVVESLAPAERGALYKHCRNAGRIFSKAGTLLQERRDGLTGPGLAEVLKAVKSAIQMVETKLYP